MKWLSYLSPIWPSLALLKEKSIIAETQSPQLVATWNKDFDDVISKIKNKEIAIYEAYAEDVWEGEGKRRETIENKAGAIIPIASVSLSIVAVGIAILQGNLLSHFQNFPLKLAGLAIMAAVGAAIYFLSAVSWALRVRSISPFAFPQVDDIFQRLVESPEISRGRILAHRIASLRWNEKVMIRKSNLLFVSEQFYFRGIVCLISAIALIAAAYGAPSICAAFRTVISVFRKVW